MTHKTNPRRGGNRAGANSNSGFQFALDFQNSSLSQLPLQLAWPAAHIARRYRVSQAMAPTIAALAGIGGAA
jgi:hypothetical protein